MSTVGLLLATAALGGLGSLLRHEVLARSGPPGSSRRMRAVAAVNLGGTLLLALLQLPAVGEELRLAVGLGLCGSVTTFSTWMVEAVRRVEEGAAVRRVATVEVGTLLLAGVLIVVTGVRLAAGLAA